MILSLSTLARWWKFNLVGGIGILVQFGALFLLRSRLHFNYLAATTIAVEAAILHNFAWHERFTWVDRAARFSGKTGRNAWLLRILRFHLANGAISILGNLALMKWMVGQTHVNYLVANAIAIAVCSLGNFLASEAWVFRNK